MSISTPRDVATTPSALLALKMEVFKAFTDWCRSGPRKKWKVKSWKVGFFKEWSRSSHMKSVICSDISTVLFTSVWWWEAAGWDKLTENQWTSVQFATENFGNAFSLTMLKDIPSLPHALKSSELLLTCLQITNWAINPLHNGCKIEKRN